MKPLNEVFGFDVRDQSVEAVRSRKNRLCPFNNDGSANCTKDKAQDPLGVCSIVHNNQTAVICPSRFRQDWVILDEASKFFFSPKTKWTSITEVRIKDSDGKAAGNIDVVLVSHDNDGRITDFGALEVQAVYVSGNVRNPFKSYISNPTGSVSRSWEEENPPRPDYLSSTRKRLAPQLLFKGGIVSSWGKKSAVVVDRGLFATIPRLKKVKKSEADLLWIVTDLSENYQPGISRKLVVVDLLHTKFEESLATIVNPKPGDVNQFYRTLQKKLDSKLKLTEPSKERLMRLK